MDPIFDNNIDITRRSLFLDAIRKAGDSNCLYEHFIISTPVGYAGRH